MLVVCVYCVGLMLLLFSVIGSVCCNVCEIWLCVLLGMIVGMFVELLGLGLFSVMLGSLGFVFVCSVFLMVWVMGMFVFELSVVCLIVRFGSWLS